MKLVALWSSYILEDKKQISRPFFMMYNFYFYFLYFKNLHPGSCYHKFCQKDFYCGWNCESNVCGCSEIHGLGYIYKHDLVCTSSGDTSTVLTVAGEHCVSCFLHDCRELLLRPVEHLEQNRANAVQKTFRASFVTVNKCLTQDLKYLLKTLLLQSGVFLFRI